MIIILIYVSSNLQYQPGPIQSVGVQIANGTSNGGDVTGQPNDENQNDNPTPLRPVQVSESPVTLSVSDEIGSTLLQQQQSVGGGRSHGHDSDFDNDGLSNSRERSIGTDPHDRDTDHDGLRDNVEVNRGTNPLSADTDGDAISDRFDACPNEPETFNGLNDTDGCPDTVPLLDSDGDSVPDSSDNCPTASNISQSDIDGDGMGDACDPDGSINIPGSDGCHSGIGSAANNTCPDPAPLDTDGDGVPDASDACPSEVGIADNNGCPVPPLLDADGDGVADAIDQCAHLPGSAINDGCPVPPPLDTDTDNDGLPDGSDGCPAQAGPTDNDGCPITPIPPALDTPPVLDTDSDDVPDAIDQCPTVPGPATNNGCSVTVPLGDTTSPSLSCPSPLTLESSSQGGISKTYSTVQQFLRSASASDDTDPDPSITNDAPDNFVGNTLVTFTASDSSGNQESCASSVEVELISEIPSPQTPKQPVGGEILPLDMTALFVAGAMTSLWWLIPAIFAGIFGVMLSITRSKNNQK